jgi:hypothetical protein
MSVDPLAERRHRLIWTCSLAQRSRVDAADVVTGTQSKYSEATPMRAGYDASRGEHTSYHMSSVMGRVCSFFVPLSKLIAASIGRSHGVIYVGKYSHTRQHATIMLVMNGNKVAAPDHGRRWYIR